MFDKITIPAILEDEDKISLTHCFAFFAIFAETFHSLYLDYIVYLDYLFSIVHDLDQAVHFCWRPKMASG